MISISCVNVDRCPMRRSLGSLQHHKPPESMAACVDKPPETGQRNAVSRSLSCPARQAVRVTRKAEAAPECGVGGRIQRLLHQIGSALHHQQPQRRHRHHRRDSLDAVDLKLSCDPKLTLATSPCVPSVWLRMQSEHLADPNKKSGSLPRSFQVT